MASQISQCLLDSYEPFLLASFCWQDFIDPPRYRHGYVEPHHSPTTPLILTNLPGCLNMIGDLWTPYPQYLPPHSLKSMLIESICQFLGIFGPTVSP